MSSGARYRLTGITATLALTAIAVYVANMPPVQSFVTTTVPVLSRLKAQVMTGSRLDISVMTAVGAVGLALWPMYKPRPRRILNAAYVTQKRVLAACLALAAIGYFDYSYRLPRATLLVTTALLLVVLPAWFVLIRRTPATSERAIVVCDDPTKVEEVFDAIDMPVLGYVAPPTGYYADEPSEAAVAVTDGSGTAADARELACLGGLSRLEEVLLDLDVDTAVFAFERTDRQEFFGALGACHEHGVAAKIHREQADSVLVADDPGSEVVDIQVEPWDWQDRVLKRVFDIGFAAVGLVVLSPLIAAIALAIKLDDGGPVLYSQQRTTEFGETFSIYKFRSMKPDSEDVVPGEEEDRITHVGGVLRRTHLDEIPQLWSILVGDMSVVGPRAAWTGEEYLLEDEVDTWSQRWFVKPGLTGLAQINQVKSDEPEKKLRYDLEYIRRQSFLHDVAIVVRQVWMVLEDLVAVPRGA